MKDIIQELLGEEDVSITVGLLLPPEQEQLVTGLSNKIAQEEECSYIANVITNPPRVRLYESVFPINETERVRERVRLLARQMVPITLAWGLVEATEHLVAVWGEANEPLQLFQAELLEQISPLRHGEIKEKYFSNQVKEELTEPELESLERWGSPWASPYLPHMIISKAKDKYNVIPEIEWSVVESKLGTIMLGIRRYSQDLTIEKLPLVG